MQGTDTLRHTCTPVHTPPPTRDSQLLWLTRATTPPPPSSGHHHRAQPPTAAPRGGHGRARGRQAPALPERLGRGSAGPGVRSGGTGVTVTWTEAFQNAAPAFGSPGTRGSFGSRALDEGEGSSEGQAATRGQAWGQHAGHRDRLWRTPGSRVTSPGAQVCAHGTPPRCEHTLRCPRLVPRRLDHPGPPSAHAARRPPRTAHTGWPPARSARSHVPL